MEKKSRVDQAIEIGSLPYTHGVHLVVKIIPDPKKSTVTVGSHHESTGEFYGDCIMVSRANLTKFIALMQKAHSDISSIEAQTSAQVSH